MKIVARVLLAIAALYAAWFAVVLFAMCQPPERFGTFMRHAPAPLVFALLPAERMWLWARGGSLRVGDVAPDFTLPLQHGGGAEVTLSSYRRSRPVVLIFGSYT